VLLFIWQWLINSRQTKPMRKTSLGIFFENIVSSETNLFVSVDQDIRFAKNASSPLHVNRNFRYRRRQPPWNENNFDSSRIVCNDGVPKSHVMFLISRVNPLNQRLFKYSAEFSSRAINAIIGHLKTASWDVRRGTFPLWTGNFPHLVFHLSSNGALVR